MTTNTNNLVAISDLSTTSGQIVFVKLSGAVNAAELRESLLNAGLSADDLPAMPSPKDAIRAAVSSFKGSKFDVTNIKQGQWSINRKTGAKAVMTGDVASLVVLAVSLGTSDPDKLAFEHDSSDATLSMAEQITTEYNRLRRELTAIEVSRWVSETMRGLNAVAIHSSAYFMPKNNVAQWQKVAGVLCQAQPKTRFNYVPCMDQASTLETIVAGLADEAEKMASTVFDQIDRGVGVRGLNARSRDCAALTDKMASYETLLGQSLETIKSRLAEIAAAASAAALVAAQNA